MQQAACHKRGYSSLRHAREIINLIQGRRHATRRFKAKRLRAYRCPDCGLYHLTKKREMGR